MSDFKTLKVLLEELIREEKRGQRFYNDAAKYVEDGRVRRLFQHLAAEESQHVEILKKTWVQIEASEADRKLRDSRYGSKARVIEYAGTSHPVFIVDDRPVKDLKLPKFELFKAGDFKALLEEISLGTVLKFAMQIEYDNTQYIVKFMKFMRDRNNIELLKKMADEEKQHFLMLKELYSKLQDAL